MKTDGMAFLSVGFRPFFLGASLFAVVSMALWMGVLTFGLSWRPTGGLIDDWHAHEMVFGYAVAVIAGFLLTAVPNWTKHKTVEGMPLLVLFALWVLARILPLVGGGVPLTAIAVVDCAFVLLLAVSIVIPIVKAKQWGNLVILAQLGILTISNVMYYAGHHELGIYAGFYSILAIVFVISRRVLPMFISKGVGYPFKPRHYKWIDKSSLATFLLFAAVDLFNPSDSLIDEPMTRALAGILFVMHAIKLYGWHTPGIWKKPLLWVLYLAYAVVVFGFFLRATHLPQDLALSGAPRWIPTHAFAIGGIGMMTVGIMSRVSLGHTGRVVANHSKSLGTIFGFLLCAAIFRVLLPVFNLSQYPLWIFIAQTLWMISFLWFLAIYARIWVGPDKES